MSDPLKEIKAHNTIVFIVAGTTSGSDACIFIEQIAVGHLATRNGDVTGEGIRLLSVSKAVAFELYRNYASARALTSDVEFLDELRSGSPRHFPPFQFIFEQPKEARSRYIREFRRPFPSSDLYREFERRLVMANSLEEFHKDLSQLTAETRERIDTLARKETDNTLRAFAGDAKTVPAYAEWLMQQFGALRFLHFQEWKQPLGREDALTLLSLKIRRGGPDRLRTIQQTVRGLLEVTVDAFEAESSDRRPAESRGAEMDVDDFLVEANGADIREALRIILDLELKHPDLVLIEEPEVHLHPGLARVVASYLQDRSREIQMFIATHSTEFVDFVSFKNLYVVSRNAQKKTICEAAQDEDTALKVPAELGLRLSSVFMFDRLVFVEGPSDEGILRELAKGLELDLAKGNVGFVHMAGVRNFAHFAAETTLDLLSRRRVGMWFMLDRDERDDEEVARMMARLGSRAKLKVLANRELENYLLNEVALLHFIREKQRASGIGDPQPDEDGVRRAIHEEAVSLKEEVIRLRLEGKLLKPVFLRTRKQPGTIGERIRAAIADLDARAKAEESEKQSITEEVERDWEGNAVHLAPGSLILSRVAKRYGVRYSKDGGDGERLARLLPPPWIPRELRELLEELVQD